MYKYKEYINSIWKVCCSVRGTIELSDYPFVILPAFLLKWSELKNKEEGFETYKGIYSPARLAVTFGNPDKPEDVIKYILEIEDAQKNVCGGYIREVAEFLERIPAHDFSEILKVVGEMPVKDSSEIYDIAEAFIRHVAVHSRRASTTVSSSTGTEQIEKMALGMVTEEDTVFDGFAGSGISAIKASGGQGKLILADIQIKYACMAEIMCILKGVQSSIHCEDSLFDSDLGSDSDFVTIEPAFGVKGAGEKKLPFYDPDYDIMCLKYAISKLNDNGKAVVLSPAGVLFRGGRTEAGRKELIANNIETVIQLPSGSASGAFAFISSVACAVLVLRKNKKDDKVLFIDASSLLETVDKVDNRLKEGKEDLLKDILEKRIDVEGVSKLVSAEEIANSGYSLVVSKYLNNVVYEVKEVDVKPLMQKSAILEMRLNELNQKLSKTREKYLV